MIDEADRAAIALMAHLCEYLVTEQKVDGFPRFQAMKILYHAIRHLAYPDRDVYPKVRDSRKGDPIVRRRYNYDDVR